MTLKEKREKLQDLLAEAEALQNLMETDEGLTAEQENQWTFLMDKDSGQIHQLSQEIKADERLDAEKKRLLELKAAGQGAPEPLIPTGKPEPKVQLPNVVHYTKLRAFTGANRHEANERAYHAGMFIRGLFARINGNPDERAEQICQKYGTDIRATATEGNPTAGGYLVPEPLAAAIINYRDMAGVSRRLCRVMPMTSDSLDVAKKTATTTVYYPGEAGTITASDQTFGNVNLNAKKRAILSYISQELVDDAVIAVVDDLAAEMGNDLAIKEDDEFINGDGEPSTYGGVTGLKNAIGSAGVATAASGEDTWPELDVDDHTAAMGKLASKYWGPNVAWLCSAQYYYTTMLKIMAEAGGNVIQSLEAGPGGMPQFLGAPVYFSSKAPTATAAATIAAYFGNFNAGVMIGDRSGIRIMQSEHVAFATDRLALKATTRYDIVCHEVGDSSTAGAVTAVKTAA